MSVSIASVCAVVGTVLTTDCMGASRVGLRDVESSLCVGSLGPDDGSFPCGSDGLQFLRMHITTYLRFPLKEAYQAWR